VGGGDQTVEVDPGVFVSGGYLIPLKIKMKVEEEDLQNIWFHDPDGFIMTVVPVS
jgi:hypothetical protein